MGYYDDFYNRWVTSQPRNEFEEENKRVWLVGVIYVIVDLLVLVATLFLANQLYALEPGIIFLSLIIYGAMFYCVVWFHSWIYYQFRYKKRRR